MSEDAMSGMPGREVQWQLLLDGLGSMGEVTEVGPGRLEIRLRSSQTVLTAVVSPDEWEQVLLNDAYGEPDYFGELISPRDDDEHFLVVHNGRMERSIREALPPVRGTAMKRKLAAYRAEHPNARLGWFANPPGEDQREP